MEQLANNDELILEFFIEEYKPINSLEDFTSIVRKIEKIKNYSAEIFIKLLIYHRIFKGNKQLFYIGMMVLIEEDPDMYVKILNLNILKFYSKDLLRLCRIYNFMGQRNSDSKIKINIQDTKGHKNIKLIMWNKKNCSDDLLSKDIYLSVEAKLYGDGLYRTIKEILNGNYESNDILPKKKSVFMEALMKTPTYNSEQLKVNWSFPIKDDDNNDLPSDTE
jgi:hypothetical protein